jgi:hypothetical protein
LVPHDAAYFTGGKVATSIFFDPRFIISLNPEIQPSYQKSIQIGIFARDFPLPHLKIDISTFPFVTLIVTLAKALFWTHSQVTTIVSLQLQIFIENFRQKI